MSNYDFALDMNSENSAAQILRNIRVDSDVLEIGCAHGRMTKFLREQLGCRVSIVEKDSEAGSIAATFANDATSVGAESGDLEKEHWHEHIRRNRQSFDFIILADVLEHLSRPERVLERAIEFLRPGGSIWVSVPNLTHNSVLIEMLNDRFEYKDVGLLDKTHIHLFSEQSLLKLIRSAGLRVARRLDPIQWVTHTEFKSSYAGLPRGVVNFLKARKNGEVYQFVWELKVQ